MINKIFEEFSQNEVVDAIAIGGSRANGVYDEKSDYDIYVYCNGNFSEKLRKEILDKYCSVTEIGNKYWEYEDNCILNNGIGLDIIYRNLDEFEKYTEYVVEKFSASCGYTTCFWHNIITSKIVFDRNGDFARVQKRFNVPYPKQLKINIINKNMNLLNGVLPSYDLQIKKAFDRGDYVSVNHRIAGFVASYFDVIFALNEKTHPGEKRLIQLCKEQCNILPEKFEENLNTLLKSYPDCKIALSTISSMVEELKKVVNNISI